MVWGGQRAMWGGQGSAWAPSRGQEQHSAEQRNAALGLQKQALRCSPAVRTGPPLQVEKSPKPVASCAMPAAPGMVIKTNTPLVSL